MFEEPYIHNKSMLDFNQKKMMMLDSVGFLRSYDFLRKKQQATNKQHTKDQTRKERTEILAPN